MDSQPHPTPEVHAVLEGGAGAPCKGGRKVGGWVCVCVWGVMGEGEEREINKTVENRSINISAAAPFTDFSWSHERWRERDGWEGGEGMDG